MKNYTNRINRLKIDIEELELKIARAVNQNKPAFAKRLSVILEREKEKLQRWLSV